MKYYCPHEAEMETSYGAVPRTNISIYSVYISSCFDVTCPFNLVVEKQRPGLKVWLFTVTAAAGASAPNRME